MNFIIVQFGRIGDMILLTPLFNRIKHLFPNANIDLLAGRHNNKIVINNPNLNNIFIYEKTPLKFISLINQLRKNRYDFLIDPKDHYSRESHLFAKLIKAKNKIGFNSNGKKTINQTIPSQEENEGKHYIERILQPLYFLDYTKEVELPKPELFLFNESEIYFNEFLKKNIIDDYIVLNISASRKSKMWKSHKWIDFLENTNFGKFKIILVNSPTEKEASTAIKEKCPYVNLFPSRSIQDVVSVINRATLVISPDTAIVHIAAAFDKPLFALYNGLENFYTKFYPLCSEKCIIKANSKEDSIENIPTEIAISQFKEFIKKYL